MPRPVTDTENHEPLLAKLLPVSCALLIALRWLLPTEATALGETVLIAQLWFGVLLLWVWEFWKSGETRVRGNRADLAVGLLILSQVAASLGVIFTEGNKRAAMNYLWEWLSLGVLLFVLKQMLTTREEARRLLRSLLLFATVLAGLGLWQHYVWFPAESSRYSLVRTELDELEGKSTLTASEFQRQRELLIQFSELGIPTEGSSRVLWEQRLQNSSEPFGPFALANTFAGLLVVFLLLALGWAFSQWRDPGTAKNSRLMVPLISAGLLLFCLLLTKSRTAFVGLLAGFTVWGWLQFQEQKRIPSLWILGGLAGVFLLGIGGAALSGGLDLQVLTESSKSLRYRVQYWSGSWEMVKEHPVLGVGPGNFRPHYLKHKLPESSEEIADPHNFVFDIWTGSGTLGLLALLAAIIAGWWLLRNAADDEADDPNRDKSADSSKLFSPWDVGIVIALLSLILWDLVIGQIDWRNVSLCAAFVGSVFLFRKLPARAPVPVAALTAACVALLVHLLGAGGIAMPGITQLLLILLAVASAMSEPKTVSETVATRGNLAGGVIALGLFASCLLTTTLPVFNVESLINAGDYSLGTSPRQAARLYQEAADADPLASLPWERLAEFSLQQWQAAPEDTGPFLRGVKFWQEAIARDPHSFTGYQRLGHWYWEKFNITNDPADAQQASEFLQAALDRYPHNVQLLWESTRALHGAGKAAAATQQAKRTAAQHELNKSEGHRDKLLTDEQLDLLNTFNTGAN